MGSRGRVVFGKGHILLRLAAIVLPGVLVLATLSLTAFAKTNGCTEETDAVESGTTVQISYRGQKLRTSASGETVEELLAGLCLTVGEGDVLSHPLDTVTFGGMQLRVDAVVTREEVYTAVLRRVPHSEPLPSGHWNTWG